MKRAFSMQQFLDWADEREGQEVVLLYFEHLKESSRQPLGRGPSRSWASLYDHPRVKGIATSLALKKQPLKQAPPLTVTQVMALEDALFEPKTEVDKVAAGYMILA
eukprot:4365143-Amphidinium_carterae.1